MSSLLPFAPGVALLQNFYRLFERRNLKFTTLFHSSWNMKRSSNASGKKEVGLSQNDVSDLIDSLCALAHHHEIYFLWRPSLPDANDDLILELAVSAHCDYIVTHNLADFKGIKKFGIKAVSPREFLQIIAEV